MLRAGLSLALVLALAFVVLAPPERCPSVTVPELRTSAQAAVDWFVRNQEPDGSWLYLYDAEEESSSAEYNAVRHAGVTMGLYQASAAGLAGALESADRGLAWAFERLIEHDGWTAVEYAGEADTGASALLAAGLAIRRQATGDVGHDELLRRLGRFLVAQTEPSGAVLATYDPDEGAPIPGEYSKYFTGEAYWALALLQHAFPGEGWGGAADHVGAYVATTRDDAEDHWPPLPDHWAAYGMAERVGSWERSGVALTEDESDYARRQAELFGGQARWVAQRMGPWGGLVRGSYVPRGGGYGVTGEALTGWWLAAGDEPRLGNLREAIGERATCIAGLTMRAQSDSADAAGAERPERVEGAWFRDGETRMDDQQHALAALLRTIPIVESGEGSSDSDEDPPSAWLWLVALVVALNPARAAFAVPRAGRSTREIAGVAALGGTLGGLAACAFAAVADPLLDVLDVSDPSFRIAAGVVAAFAGAADLFRRPPAPDPALEGWRSALVPVTIPGVARPALLVLALGAGAEESVLIVLAAMGIAVALLTAVAAGGATEGPPGRVLRWASRLLAAVLVACGVVLVVDGVLAV